MFGQKLKGIDSLFREYGLVPAGLCQLDELMPILPCFDLHEI